MKIMHSKVMTIANRLTMSGIGRTTAMLKAWALIKMPLVETPVAGVTQGRRQEALEHLTHYKASDVRVYLCRDKRNPHDGSAVAVVVSVAGSGSYCMGYLPRPLAALIAPLMDAGKVVQSAFKGVCGAFSPFACYGLSIQIIT